MQDPTMSGEMPIRLPSVKKSISIGIRTAGTERLAKIFNTLDKQSFRDEISEVIILDSKLEYAKQEVGLISHCGLKCRTIQTEIPFSYPGSLNQIMRKSKADIVVVLSGHTLPLGRDWLECLVAPFLDETCGAVCGGQICSEEASAMERFYRHLVFGSPAVGKLCQAFNASHVAILRSAWEMAPFDICVPYGEDRKWALDIKKLGWKVDRNFRAKAIHSHGYSNFEAMRYIVKQFSMAMRVIIKHHWGRG